MTNHQLIDKIALAEEFSEELQRIIDFWTQTAVDRSTPGFHGHIEKDGTINHDANKGSILCSRILWFLSEAAIHTGDPEVVAAADHIYAYAIGSFLDERNGGFYWSLNPDSAVANGRKQTFAQAFFIYAICAYYRLKQDKEILEKAKELWLLLENKTSSGMTGCHVAAFDVNWVPLENMGLGDINGPHTLDTELHVLEAYTALYKIAPNQDLEKNLRLCLNVFAEYFIDSETWTLHSHLDYSGESISQVVLYGHNVECGWLIWEAVEALNDKELTEYWKPIVLSLINYAIANGLDDSGKLSEGYELRTGTLMNESVWWVQAETIVALLQAEKLDPHKNYLNHLASSWNHIKTKHIDKVHGEWLGYSIEDSAISSLVSEWKGPYHNGRAMLKAVQFFN